MTSICGAEESQLTPELAERGEQHSIHIGRTMMKAIQSALRLNELLCATLKKP